MSLWNVLVALLALYLCLQYVEWRSQGTCPVCGARDEDGHAKDCSWRG